VAMVNVDTRAGYSDRPEVNWLGSKVSGRLALLCIHQMNRVNSYNSCGMTTAL